MEVKDQARYAAISDLHHSAAAIEAIAVLLSESEGDIAPVPAMGVGHLCHLLYQDLERATEVLSG